MVLHTLRLLACHVKIKKAFFGFPEVIYVGHKLNGMSLALEESRVAAVRDWPLPRSRANCGAFWALPVTINNLCRSMPNTVYPSLNY